MTPLHWLLWVVCLDILLVLALLCWRQVQRARSQYRQRFVEQWRRALMHYVMDAPEQVRAQSRPVLHRKDYTLFFMLWNDTQQQWVGAASPRLNQLIWDLELVPEVLSRLKAKDLRTQMIACQTLGHLEQVEAAWPMLVALAFSPHDRLSFFALQALIQMSPQATLPVLLEVLNQEQTSQARILGLFRRYPSPNLVRPLLDHLQEALYRDDLRQALHILALLEVLPYPSVLPTMRQVLVEATEPELMISCLRVMADLHDPWCLGLSLPYLEHEVWAVRQQAVQALGKVAQTPQIPLLLKGLEDPSFWVAQAAFEAIWNIPGVRREKLVAWGDAHADPETKVRLQQFLAERTHV